MRTFSRHIALIKRSFFRRDAASQIVEKFAFIPAYCYYVADFGGVELPPYGCLKENNLSRSGGENSANLALSRITTPFGRAVGATLAAGAMIAMPLTATANDAAERNFAVSAQSQTVAFTPLPKRETPYCAPNELNRHGLEMGGSATAMEYSAENLGAVGIYIAPGDDLNGYTPEQVGQYLINYFADAGIEAECFISDRQAANGTALDFKVNNLSWGKTRRLNLQEATDSKTLQKIVASARMGKFKDHIAMAPQTGALNP